MWEDVVVSASRGTVGVGDFEGEEREGLARGEAMEELQGGVGGRDVEVEVVDMGEGEIGVESGVGGGGVLWEQKKDSQYGGRRRRHRELKAGSPAGPALCSPCSADTESERSQVDGIEGLTRSQKSLPYWSARVRVTLSYSSGAAYLSSSNEHWEIAASVEGAANETMWRTSSQGSVAEAAEGTS